MEQRYKKLRSQLEDLGYHQSLKPDCVPLVEKVVADLIQTTSSLQKYMTIAKDAINERDNLLLGAEPYKCDNAKLVKECNELHLAFLQFREQNEKLQKDLKKRIAKLEEEKINSDSEKNKLLNRLRELELESAKKSTRILSQQNTKLGIKPPFKSSSTSAMLKSKNPKEKDKCDMMALSEQKVTNLMKEVTRLKDEQLELTETNMSLKNQIGSRDKEIQRLTNLLEGGRPTQALNQDCCYKDIDSKILTLQNEIKLLQRSNNDLETRLKEAISKQHEAMKRALNLAERNKILEKEMRDIDQIALAVESECNTTVKNNAEKVSRLQDRVNETVLEIQRLERDKAELRRDKKELMANLDVIKTEKRHLQMVLETALDEKKRLTDRINQFTIIENDLNLEIDRLVRASAAQKQKIAELECRLLSGQLDSSFEAVHTQHGKKAKKKVKPISSTKPKQNQSLTVAPVIIKPKSKSQKMKKSNAPAEEILEVYAPKNTPTSQSNGLYSKDGRNSSEINLIKSTTCHEPDSCVTQLKAIIAQELRNKDICLSHLKELIGKEIDHLQAQADLSLEHFKSERDYYMKECHALMEKMKNMCNKPDNITDLAQKLNEKEQLVMTLQHENRSLAQEKHNLMTRLETVRDNVDKDFDSLSMRSISKRLERERDLLKADIQRLEEERDGLRQRLNIMAENHMTERSRLESMLKQTEEEVRKLEKDRREYTQTRGSSRATINNLQEECDMLKDQLKTCQSDLNQQRSLYNQIRVLHEQTDRALADSQGQLMQLEKELYMAQEKIKSYENNSGSSDKEIINLKNDIAIMKGHLMKVEQEKDVLVLNLDDKTEKLVALEQDLNTRGNTITSLETAIKDLKKQLSMAVDDVNSREQMLRNVKLELNKLQQELEAAIRAKEVAYQENRRIQEDLAACTASCNKTQTELDIARRQVDDLKRQLQHYVSEVKRTEDLISQKEIERSEMLDHFRSLSQEANILENNNYSLESETSQTKIQLSLALDHVADLERKLESQDTMIRSYEKQIADLTAQIARMEMQLTQNTSAQEQYNTELAAMRELCVKLDKQKDALMRQLSENGIAKAQSDHQIENLRLESERIQTDFLKNRSTNENLEKLLADSRQETIDQRLLNGELRAEIQILKTRLEELHSKLYVRSNVSQPVVNNPVKETNNEKQRIGSNHYNSSSFESNYRPRSKFSIDRDLGTSSTKSYGTPPNPSLYSAALKQTLPSIRSLTYSIDGPSTSLDSNVLNRNSGPASNSVSMQAQYASNTPDISLNVDENFALSNGNIQLSSDQTIVSDDSAEGNNSQHNIVRNKFGYSVPRTPYNSATLASQTVNVEMHELDDKLSSLPKNVTPKVTSYGKSSPKKSLTILDKTDNSIGGESFADELSREIQSDLEQSNVDDYFNKNVASVSMNKITSYGKSSPKKSLTILDKTDNSIGGESFADELSREIQSDLEQSNVDDYFNKNVASVSMNKITPSFDKHYIKYPDAMSSANVVSQENKLPSPRSVRIPSKHQVKHGMYRMVSDEGPSVEIQSVQNYEFFGNDDKEQDNPMDDEVFRDKLLRTKSCACLRVCECHIKPDGSAATDTFIPAAHGKPTFTCVFTTAGTGPDRYTATYTFAYTDLNTTPLKNPIIQSTEINK